MNKRLMSDYLESGDIEKIKIGTGSVMPTAEKALVLPSGTMAPTQQDILDTLGVSNQSELIDTDFTALATNGEEFFQVFYSHDLNAFFSHQLVVANNSVKPNVVNDLLLNASVSLGNGISRSEIEDTITDSGYNLPSKPVMFYIEDPDGHTWFLRYIPAIDKYAIEKLTLK